ncbi:hypothetical protein QZH41_001847 [Actinostola sp. cb2023]|nr:hypothetical protein QZH41_001847 [Actinostola sp. cb2023]
MIPSESWSRGIMVKVECSVPHCDFKTDDVSEAIAIALLANHGLAHQSTPPAIARGPKLDRPKVNVGVSTEGWNVFVRRWEVFRTGSGIDNASAPAQLFQCAGIELGDNILKANPDAASDNLPQLLADKRSLAVIPVATGVLRTELLQLRQERDEAFRAFTARMRGKAETCAFATKCECGKSVDYTNQVIRDVLLNGISDPDIRREVLGTKDILKTPVNDVVSLVENKEMARNALPSSTLYAVSSFRRQQNPLTGTTAAPPSHADRPPTHADGGKEARCPDCKNLFKIFTEGARGWNTKPHQVCVSCYRARRRSKRPLQAPPASPTSVQAALEPDPISQVAAFQPHSVRSPHPRRRQRRHRRRRASATHSTVDRRSPVVLDHHVFTKGEWKWARLRAHPRVSITISVDILAPAQHGSPAHKSEAEVSAVVDTGAQSDLWSLADFLACGFSRDELNPVSLGLSVANRSPISIEGAFFARLTGKSRNGEVTSCRSMVYVSSSVNAMYLSCESLLNFGILSHDFPSFDNASTPSERCHTDDHEVPNTPCELPPINATRSINDGCNAPSTLCNATCSCPQREVAPPRPSELPFPCTSDNNGRMKTWLLDSYASSTFNTCPHRALPCMEGPPVEMHIDPAATPKACHTPANVPLHW